MSALLEANWPFINLLLGTSRKQQLVLLDNLTDSQIDLISEIFFNLWNIVELHPGQQKFLKRRAGAISDLAQISSSRKFRQATIKRLKAPVLAVLGEVSENILIGGRCRAH